MMQTIKPDNYFYLRNGEKLRSIKELEKELEKNTNYENLENFYHHVTNEKNDYANWIKNVFHKQELYEKMKNVKKPDELLRIILEEQTREHKEKHKKIDLERIKHELEINKKITRKEKAKAILKKIIKPKIKKNKEEDNKDKKTIFKKILNKIRRTPSDNWMKELEKEAKKIKNKKSEEEEEEEQTKENEKKQTISVTENLLSIIKEAKKLGKTNEEIKKILIGQGISSEILNKIFSSQNEEESKTEEQENKEETKEETKKDEKETGQKEAVEPAELEEQNEQPNTESEQKQETEQNKEEEPEQEDKENNDEQKETEKTTETEEPEKYERQEKTEEQKLAEEKERDLRAERAENLLEKTRNMKSNSYLNYEKQKETVSDLKDIYEELYSEISDYRKQGKDMFMPYMNLRLIKPKLSFLEVSNKEQDRRQVMKLLEGVKKEIKESVEREELNVKKEVLQAAGLYEEKKEE
ncbi:hypothetical protein KO361_00190 [Candidatus Woesearchaeota archaeon]|nr:hypothetical protein [Candidatus Woesearchaeota archaeon]